MSELAHYPTHAKPMALPAKCDGYTSAQRIAYIYRARRKDAARLDFSENWNHRDNRGGKLANRAFTTIRRSRMLVGNWYKVYLGSAYVGDAIVIDSRQVLGDNLTESQCYCDTGYGKAETLRILDRMYGGGAASMTFHFATLVFIEPEITTEPQSQLFG